jgi:ABC-type glycerol-3-phosphate transport system substrate-binding protein
MRGNPIAQAPVSRRSFLKRIAIGAGSTVAAPYTRTSYAAGRLTLGVWDHWVPGANDVLQKICADWGESNRVEVQIDFITGLGGKLSLTAAAEAQARGGHDVLSYYGNWEVALLREKLEPVDDVVGSLVQNYGPLNAGIEQLGKHEDHWHAVPATAMSNLFCCGSRLELYERYADFDLRKVFPPNDNRDNSLVDTWDWNTYLVTARRLHKANAPVGLPISQAGDAMVWVGAMLHSFGSVMIDENDNITVNSDATRAALEYMRKLAPVNAPGAHGWDDAANNKWLISGQGSSIINPPSAWAVARRDNPTVAGQCWHHAPPRGPRGRYTAYNPKFYGIWNFSKNKKAAKDLLVHISQKEQSQQLVAASHGYDIPPFASFYGFDQWAREGPPIGTLYNYPLRGDNQSHIVGYPARPEVAAQITGQSIQPMMISRATLGGESIELAIKWAERELEGCLRR